MFPSTPTISATRKQPLVIEVRYGHVYVMHRFDGGGERVGPNFDDYIVLDEAQAIKNASTGAAAPSATDGRPEPPRQGPPYSG